MNLEIVERSSGWWIVGENGVEHYEPFDEIEDAIEKMNELNLRERMVKLLPKANHSQEEDE
jgi:hypothetical protein